IEAFARGYVMDQFAQYGLTDPEEARVHEMAGRLLSNEEQVRKMRDTIVEHKLTAHFKAMLSPKEKHMPLEAFINLARTI
ncbi:MAG TPA: hypothetical protein PLL18_14700, partial [Flavobacteriales bacterium]|nr:hypothetical protein [Flavobacteriales bacterium]